MIPYTQINKSMDEWLGFRRVKMFESETGAKRSERVVRYDLIPKIFLERLASRFTGNYNNPELGGALKYGECNWEKGLVTSDTINHIIDHLNTYTNHFRQMLKYSDGNMSQVAESLRSFSDNEDHLAGAAFGIAVLMHQEDSLVMFHDNEFSKPTGFGTVNQTNVINEKVEAKGYSDVYVESLQRENQILRELATKLERNANVKHRKSIKRQVSNRRISK